MLPLLLIQLSSGAASYVPAFTRVKAPLVLVSWFDDVHGQRSAATDGHARGSHVTDVKVDP